MVTQIDRPVFLSRDYREVGTLALSPETLSTAYDIAFQSDRDDLDALVWAALQLPSGHSVVLVRCANVGTEGTDVVADTAVDTPGIRRELLAELALPPSAFECALRS